MFVCNLWSSFWDDLFYDKLSVFKRRGGDFDTLVVFEKIDARPRSERPELPIIFLRAVIKRNETVRFRYFFRIGCLFVLLLARRDFSRKPFWDCFGKQLSATMR